MDRRGRMRRYTQIALLGSIAFLFFAYLEIPRGFFLPFLKYDLGDVPALIATFALGPVPGIAVELIKGLLAVVFTFKEHGPFGILMNTLAGVSFIGIPGGYYLVEHTKAGGIKSLTLCTIRMTAGVIFSNRFLNPDCFPRLCRPALDASG